METQKHADRKLEKQAYGTMHDWRKEEQPVVRQPSWNGVPPALIHGSAFSFSAKTKRNGVQGTYKSKNPDAGSTFGAAYLIDSHCGTFLFNLVFRTSGVPWTDMGLP